ncbi:unnamed protein product, partial [Hapterophycus canaliculatus]
DQFKVSSHSRDGSESCAWKSEHSRGTQSNGERGTRNEAEAGGWTERAEEKEQGDYSLCHEMASRQNEKDQRMWSALKNSLLSKSREDADSSIAGFRTARIDDGGNSDGGSNCNGDSRIVVRRDMEQLDLERSAMDRTIRPHRIASARALEANQDSPLQTKVKQPRTFSARATRSRTRKNDLVNTLHCTGTRAELVSRSGDAQSGFSSEAADATDAVDSQDCSGFTGLNRHREGAQPIARKADVGRFQWVTNDEGVANFLQRPPSRQKEAFPTHLADVVPYPAFQVSTKLLAQSLSYIPSPRREAKQLVDATRKDAVEQSRPPSRHKPPGQSLFLDVPETRRQVQPMFSLSRGTLATGADSCDGTTRSVETTNAEASSRARETLRAIFALDRRQDNPDRDGNVLQVQGPCPFRIEVTNSLMQLQPPTVPPNGREAALVANPRKAPKYCAPDPLCGSFGSRTYDASGRTSTEKQRAPINTTPTLTASAVGSSVPTRGDGKACFRLLGSRSTGGIASRGATIPGTYIVPGDDRSIAGGFPLPPPRTGAAKRERAAEGTFITSEVEVRRLEEGSLEGCVGRGTNAADGEKSPSAGRVDNPGLFVCTSTGGPGLHVSDWSLQSCDDADDGAFSDGPALALSESATTKHSRLETTLGQ